MKFYDCLKEELKGAGLWQWAKDKPYQEVLRKPEILMAHERAWKRWRERKAK